MVRGSLARRAQAAHGMRKRHALLLSHATTQRAHRQRARRAVQQGAAERRFAPDAQSRRVSASTARRATSSVDSMLKRRRRVRK
jgi:hypothetical protein